MQSTGYPCKLAALWWGYAFCGIGVEVRPTVTGPNAGVFTLKFKLSQFGEPPQVKIVAVPMGFELVGK